MPKINAKQIIRNAEKTHGVYVMGASGPSTWDCSGFVAHCVGIFPRGDFFTGNELEKLLALPGFKNISHIVKARNWSALKPGDILIWNKDGTTGEGANGHTAIVYKKDGTLIEATSSAPGKLVPYRGRKVSAIPWQKAARPPGGISLIKWVGE